MSSPTKKPDESEVFLSNEEAQPPAAPTASVSGKTLFFFMLLVGQSVATQTFFKLSQKGGKYEYNTMSAMTVVEGLKLIISTVQLMLDKSGNVREAGKEFKRVEKRVYGAYFFLAFSYAAYNQLVFYVMKLVDPGTFSLFKSLMPAAVGFLNFSAFGKTMTQPQLYCIIIQICGIIPVVASTNCESGKMDFTYGAKSVIIMTATIMYGGFNTVYNAAVVKKESANYPIHIQNSILYSGGFLINLISFFISSDDGDKAFFHGYGNPNVFILLFAQSTVGITISLVYKYGDAILKTLSQPMVSSILVFLSYLLFDAPLDIIKVSGAGAVIVSTMLYLKLPSPPNQSESTRPMCLPTFRRDPNAPPKDKVVFKRVLSFILLLALVSAGGMIFSSGGEPLFADESRMKEDGKAMNQDGMAPEGMVPEELMAQEVAPPENDEVRVQHLLML